MRNAVVSCILATAALSFSSDLTSAGISRTIIGRTAHLSAFRPGAARIGPSSVPRLHIAWTYPIGSVTGSVATDTRVFLNQVSARGDLVVMLDAQTGKVLVQNGWDADASQAASSACAACRRRQESLRAGGE